MNLFKKGIAVFGSNWGYNILHFLTGVYVIREFGPEGKGFVALFVAGAGFIASIMAMGQTNAAVFYIKRDQISPPKAAMRIYLLCLVGVVLCGLLFLMFGAQGWNLLFEGVDFEVASIVLLLVYFPVLLILLYLKAYYLGVHDLKGHRAVMIGSSLGSFFLTIVLVEFIFRSYYAPILALVITEFCVCIYHVIRLHQQPETNNKAIGWSEFFKFGIKSHIATVGNALFSRIDYFVIAAYIDLETLGYYSVAKFFYQALMSVPLSINGLLLGTFSGTDARNSRALNVKVFKYMLAIMAVIVVSGILVGPWAIPLIYGSDFLRSIPSYNVLLVAGFFIGSSSTFQAFFLGMGKPALTGKIGLLGGTVKLLFTLMLVSDYNILGVALATLISAFFIFSARLYLFKFKLLHARE